MAAIFTDHMVLQANQPIKIWGTAASGEVIEVRLQNERLKTKANKQGNWIVEFPAHGYGDPLSLEVVGTKNSIVLKDVLMGEVWLCSGQSNMAMTIHSSQGEVYNYKNEISTAKYPQIRSFKVMPAIAGKPAADVSGQWVVCSSETVPEFSAVAYFFARKLYQDIQVPIGIINSSWGGTDIETWTSGEAFKQYPASFSNKYKGIENGNIEAFLKKNEENRAAFKNVVSKDPGTKEEWFKVDTDLSDWKTMRQPQEWAGTALADFDGVVWFSFPLDVVDYDSSKSVKLSLGKLDDNDITWVNGVKVGETEGAGYDRMYTIPAGVLKNGKNLITIKIVDAIRAGGFTSTAKDLYIKTEDGQYSLAGDWYYKVSADTKAYRYEDVVPNIYHSLLYNGMISPLKNFVIRGVIWYQGENNAGNAYQYRQLFPGLIQDWRKQWGYEFPFYWVQLANYLPKNEKVERYDSWAELREAQTMTLALPKTGQATIIDIGDANDIHPQNKQDVGLRLAYIALHDTYQKTNQLYEGPKYKAMKIEGNKIRITFASSLSPLVVKSKYGYIEGFTIAGADEKFVWAKARQINDTEVLVYAEDVKEPKAVRFAWAINPDVNLFNAAGLPAGPFRTDNWKISSQP